MQFKPEKININNEKQELWNTWATKVDRITDRIGYPIDQGIKEPVIVINALGFRTDGSCEGHIDRGVSYPWIDISVISEELEHEFKIYQKAIKEKEYKDEESFKKDDPILHAQVLEIKQNYIARSKEIEEHFAALSDEFYASHVPQAPENKIILHEIGNGFRMELAGSRGLGLDNWKKFDEKIKKLSIEQKKEFLELNQTEMKLFGQFLKKKFFEHK